MLCIELPTGPVTISFTNVVPVAVPSVFQSSMPFTPSYATKKIVPFTLVISIGLLPFLPGKISLIILVPAFVPSLFHNSWPVVGVSAEKYSIPFTSVFLSALPSKVLLVWFISFTRLKGCACKSVEMAIKAIKDKTILIIFFAFKTFMLYYIMPQQAPEWFSKRKALRHWNKA